MSASAVNISVEARKPIPLNFGDDHYLITAPKGYTSMALAERAQEAAANENVDAIWGEVEGWFKQGLGKKQWAKLQARLADREDPLDVIHLIQAMEGVIEKVVGDPTSSSSD